MSLKTFRLDPWGDLTLRIGPDGEAEDYIVDPRALARASPVFERMLYGDFAEGNQSAGEAVGGWTVRLPDDNPWTMGRFLSTMHGNYDESLGSLSIDEVYDLILVAHYYDAIRLLQPWAGAWLDHVKSLTEDVHAPPLKMLWVAWELGSVPLVHEICRCIVLEFDAADFANALCDANVQTPPGALGESRQGFTVPATTERKSLIIRKRTSQVCEGGNFILFAAAPQRPGRSITGRRRKPPLV